MIHTIRFAFLLFCFMALGSALAHGDESCQIKMPGSKTDASETRNAAECRTKAVSLLEIRAATKPNKSLTVKVQFGTEMIDVSLKSIADEFLESRPVNLEGRTYPLQNCENAEFRQHTVATDGDYLRSDCTPEVVYSWGTLEKAKVFGNFLAKLDSTSNRDFPERLLFASRTPTSTFGYGNTLLRIKLRPGTRIQFMPIGTTLVTKEQLCANDSVKALYYERGNEQRLSMVDYVFCGTNAIESISYGLPGALREIVNEIAWMKSTSYLNYDLWAKTYNVDTQFFAIPLDKAEFSQNALNARIVRYLGLLNTNQSALYERRGEAGGVESHFRTLQPSYFNEPMKTF